MASNIIQFSEHGEQQELLQRDRHRNRLKSRVLHAPELERSPCTLEIWASD